MGNINVNDNFNLSDFSDNVQDIDWSNEKNYPLFVGKKDAKKKIKFSYNTTINKINSHFINSYIIDLILNNSIKKDILLKKKLSHNFIANLNQKNTERFLCMKISDIFSEQDISPRYLIFHKNYNRKLIDRIYEEKKEINVIKILELTFEELFIIFRRKLNDSEN